MPTFARTIAFTADADRRSQVRPAHRAHISELFEAGSVRMSGPWADGSGAFVVYEAEDEAAARQLVARDPYVTAGGIVESEQLRAWTVVVPAPASGD